ncbi:MAG: hypothetical protein KF895_15770 [Parvibaculum sp.]|nr:hypothetical protein [Parvibaculum sp.]
MNTLIRKRLLASLLLLAVTGFGLLRPADEGLSKLAASNISTERTTDWKRQDTGVKSSLRDVHFINEQNGWAVGDKGIILHSADSGKTWVAQSSSVQTDLYGVHFVSQDVGWVVGGNGIILYTKNGGQNWNSQPSGTSSDLFDIHFVKNSGWIVGADGVVLHRPGG